MKKWSRAPRSWRRYWAVKKFQLGYFEKMIELARTELGIDLYKHSTPRSIGSGKIKKK